MPMINIQAELQEWKDNILGEKWSTIVYLAKRCAVLRHMKTDFDMALSEQNAESVKTLHKIAEKYSIGTDEDAIYLRKYLSIVQFDMACNLGITTNVDTVNVIGNENTKLIDSIFSRRQDSEYSKLSWLKSLVGNDMSLYELRLLELYSGSFSSYIQGMIFINLLKPKEAEICFNDALKLANKIGDNAILEIVQTKIDNCKNIYMNIDSEHKEFAVKMLDNKDTAINKNSDDNRELYIHNEELAYDDEKESENIMSDIKNSEDRPSTLRSVDVSNFDIEIEHALATERELRIAAERELRIAAELAAEREEHLNAAHERRSEEKDQEIFVLKYTLEDPQSALEEVSADDLLKMHNKMLERHETTYQWQIAQEVASIRAAFTAALDNNRSESKKELADSMAQLRYTIKNAELRIKTIEVSAQELNAAHCLEEKHIVWRHKIYGSQYLEQYYVCLSNYLHAKFSAQLAISSGDVSSVTSSWYNICCGALCSILCGSYGSTAYTALSSAQSLANTHLATKTVDNVVKFAHMFCPNSKKWSVELGYKYLIESFALSLTYEKQGVLNDLPFDAGCCNNMWFKLKYYFSKDKFQASACVSTGADVKNAAKKAWNNIADTVSKKCCCKNESDVDLERDLLNRDDESKTYESIENAVTALKNNPPQYGYIKHIALKDGDAVFQLVNQIGTLDSLSDNSLHIQLQGNLQTFFDNYLLV